MLIIIIIIIIITDSVLYQLVDHCIGQLYMYMYNGSFGGNIYFFVFGDCKYLPNRNGQTSLYSRCQISRLYMSRRKLRIGYQSDTSLPVSVHGLGEGEMR